VKVLVASIVSTLGDCDGLLCVAIDYLEERRLGEAWSVVYMGTFYRTMPGDRAVHRAEAVQEVSWYRHNVLIVAAYQSVTLRRRVSRSLVHASWLLKDYRERSLCCRTFRQHRRIET
jgi:hypothetical protein